MDKWDICYTEPLDERDHNLEGVTIQRIRDGRMVLEDEEQAVHGVGVSRIVWMRPHVKRVRLQAEISADGRLVKTWDPSDGIKRVIGLGSRVATLQEVVE